MEPATLETIIQAIDQLDTTLNVLAKSSAIIIALSASLIAGAIAFTK